MREKKAHYSCLRQGFGRQVRKVFAIVVLGAVFLAMALPQTAFAQGAGKALDFDGTDDYVDCGNMLDFSLTNFTIEAWFKAHTINQLDQNTFLAKWHDISGQREFRFEIDGTGIGNVIFSTQHGTAYYELHGTTALVANTWYYAVVTVDWTGDDAYLYLNATVEDSEVNTWTQSMNYETSPVIMGSRKGVDQWFDGEIDEVRIWNVALSQSTIQDWMNKNVTSSHPNWSNLMGYWRFDEGSGYTTADGSPNSNTGTLGTVVEGDAAEPSWVWSTAFGDEIFLTVKKDGTAYYTTIQAAVDAIPADLVTDGNSYIIEVQDSETYTETVTISGKTTDASHTITLKAQSGQSPTVYGQTTYRGAIHIEANYVTVDGLIVKAKGDRGDGIRLANRNYHHNTIKNCTIFNAYNSDNVAGIYVCSCHDNEIINNTIYNSLIGIRIDGDGYDYAYNNVIKNNVIYNCTNKGIWIFRGARDNTIVHNSFYGNTKEIHLGHGGEFYNAGANNVFKNNMIYAKNKGHRSESYGIAVDTYGDPGSLPSGTVFDYNCIYVPDGTFAYIDNNNHSTLSAWQSATGQDAHSISSDPLLINPSTDFHLDVNSPCKNAGADIAGVTVDFEGDPRTSGSYDMGYDEYTTANDAIARKQTLTYIVKQDGTGDYTTIQAAINAVPSNLITDGNSYIVEVQDNGIYNETVTISKTTEITHDLIVRAQTGQTPEVRGQNTYSAAFNTSTNYLTLDGFIAMGGDRRNAIKVGGSYCIIRSNTAYGTTNEGYPGIYINGGGHNQVEGNIVRNNQNGIVVYNYGGDYNTIKNNIVYSNTYRGIWVYRYTNYNNVFHNTLYNNVKEIHIGHGGEHYNCGSNNVFKNNILYASGSGTGIAVDTYLDPGTLPSGSILDYNDIYAPSGNVGYIDNNTYNTLSNWQGGSGQDANSISTDPVFVNPTTDFHLQSSGGSYHGGAWTADAGNSPCIDAGDPTFDYSNEPIPNGYRINMGAYGNTVYASKSAPVICTYNNFPRNKWVFLGVPVIPGDGDPNSILADDLDNTSPGVDWRLSRWNAADSTYYRYGEAEPNYYDSTLPTKPAADPADFTPGLGYWLWQNALDSPDIDVEGYEVSQGQDFTISLDGPVNGNRGLNMNANPFNFKIDWSNSKVSDGSETKSIKDAAIANWVSQYAYAWDSANSQYVTITPDDVLSSDTLSVWQGFWTIQLDASKSCELLIPPTQILGKKSEAMPQWLSDHLGKEASYMQLQEEESWFLNMSIKSASGDVRDTYNGLGVAADAISQYDYHDAFEFTPNATEFVMLYFPHNNPEDAGNYWQDQPYSYTYDIRNPDWEQAEWLFKVYQYGAPGDFRLNWSGLRLIPQTVRLSLCDPATGNVIIDDIRQEREYSFSLSGSEPISYKIKAERVNDETSPDFTIGITQNPIITNDVDVYILPSEKLTNIGADINGVELEMVEIDPMNIVYKCDYELEGSGNFTVNVAGIDLSDNDGAGSVTFSAQLMKSVSEGTAQSPDGVLSLKVPGGALERDKYITVFSEDGPAEWSGLTGVGLCYQVNPGTNLLRAAELSIRYNDDLNGMDESKLCIYFRNESQWIPVHSKVNADKNIVSANVSNLGTYRLFYNPDGEVSRLVPESYSLKQNYPNPFNATTLIRYQLPEDSRVTMKIFNIMGQEVNTLVDEVQVSGYYSVLWDGMDRFGKIVPSGVYFYHFNSSGFMRTRKMLLIK